MLKEAYGIALPPLLTRSCLSLWLLICLMPGCGGGPQRTVSPAGYPAGYPIGHVERGVASWYGPGFHGHKTANGERYDMHRFTAAHRTLPLGSVLQVKSLSNGRMVTVRVNDRGPFAKNRILDLSLGAAQSLGMTGAGTDQIELRVTAYQGRPGAMGYLQIQVASFAEQANAQSLAGRLKAQYHDVRVAQVELPMGIRYRVLVGRFASEQQAEAVAERLGSQFQVEPLVLRDDT
ncbi:MAG: septal ring lytic transglycosylase RlpA family protein [Nitrospirae bacterium]|nr:MAG: septal ring lytic transglycosylase RlpA family protein [Nitrospirota bacterium]